MGRRDRTSLASMRVLAFCFCFLVLSTSSSCSHTYFQYAPHQPELDALGRSTAALIAAGERGNAEAVAGFIDVDGRKATLLAAHDLVDDRSPAGKALHNLVAAI